MRRSVTLKLCRWIFYITCTIYVVFAASTYILQPLQNESSGPVDVQPRRSEQIRIVKSFNSSRIFLHKNNKKHGNLANEKANNFIERNVVKLTGKRLREANNINSENTRINKEIAINNYNNRIKEESDTVGAYKIANQELPDHKFRQINQDAGNRKYGLRNQENENEMHIKNEPLDIEDKNNRYRQVVDELETEGHTNVEETEHGRYKDMNQEIEGDIAGIHQDAHNDRYRQTIENQENAKYEPFSEDQMKMIETEMRERNERVAEVCGKYGIGRHHVRGGQKLIRYPPSANYEILYIDRPDAFSWCPVYKAASTSWLNIFCLLAGVKESTLAKSKEQISHFARRIWPSLDNDEASMAVPYTTKFMIVRHPFERIVSAYRDKLENINIGVEHGVLHFYEKYGKKIVKKYRKSNQSLPNNSSVISDPNLSKRRGVEPTFEEFVQYLIDTDLVLYADDHWIPYYLFCTSCYISYDVIAKFETIERDQKYLLQKLNLNNKIDPKWKHLTKGRKTSEVVKKYLSTLEKEQIKKLAEKYRLDFEMYGYSFHEFL